MATSICMLVTNPATHDPRVRREAASLVKAGYRVTVIGVRLTEGELDAEELDGYLVRRIPHPRLALQRLMRRFPGLYRVARWTYRRLRGCRTEPVGTRQELTGKPSVSAGTESGIATLQHDLRTILNVLWINLRLAMSGWKERADVYHAHDLDTLLAGYLCTTIPGRKLVYDYHELYTEQFQQGIKSGLWHGFFSMLEKVLAKRAHLCLTVCDSLGSWLAECRGVPGVVTVRNVPALQPVAEAGPTGRNEPTILYHGLLFRNRGLEQLIEAVPLLTRGIVVIRGYGDYEPQLRALVAAKGLDSRVQFAPPVRMVDLVREAVHADIGIAPFIPVCLNTQFCLPNKLFEYMMAGLAIAGSDLPEMRKVILGHEIGAVFDPLQPRAIADAINGILADEGRLRQMKANAKQVAASIYNWQAEERTFLKVYGDLVHRPAA